GMDEDQRLLAAVAAGFANDAFPALAQPLLDNQIQLRTIHIGREALKLRDVQIRDSLVRSLARDEADEPHERDARGMHVVAALDAVDHAVEAPVAAACQYYDWNQQSYKA